MEHLKECYYDIYKLIKFFLSVIGLWPYQSVWEAYLLRGIITIVLLIFLLLQLVNFCTSDINMEFVINMIPMILIPLVTLIYLYISVTQTDKIKEILERMWNDWQLQKTEDETKIMHETAETTRLLMIYILFLVYVFVGAYNISLFMSEILDIISPMNESRPRIIGPPNLKFYIDEERYFNLIRSYECILTFLITTVCFAAVNLFLAVTQHVCAMCKFLRFVGIIGTYYSLLSLLSIIGILVLLSLSFIQIITISGSEQALRSIVCGITQLCFIFLLSIMGQNLTDMTSSVYEKVYDSAWYDADVSEQKLLLLIMQQRFHPLSLTACNFYVMSLQNFRMILQATLSYCMFLRKIQGDVH